MNAILAAIAVAGFSQGAFQTITLKVEGVERTALVFAPADAKAEPIPAVFCWHGHGGGSRQAALSFGIHRAWPDAIVVYPQGLPTPTRNDPEGARPGWQIRAGGQGDRDLKFFDALLAQLKTEYKVDDKRVYAMGHSNGGRFTYLLWAERQELFAAFGPSGSPATGLVHKFQPKPVFHIAGEKDPLVSFASQKATIETLRGLLQCGEPQKSETQSYLRVEKGVNGTELATYVHPGGHEFPRSAVPHMVAFFKSHPRS